MTRKAHDYTHTSQRNRDILVNMRSDNKGQGQLVCTQCCQLYWFQLSNFIVLKCMRNHWCTLSLAVWTSMKSSQYGNWPLHCPTHMVCWNLLHDSQGPHWLQNVPHSPANTVFTQAGCRFVQQLEEHKKGRHQLIRFGREQLDWRAPSQMVQY